MSLPNDLKNYRAEEDGFQLIPPEVAGALVGGFVAALVTYDVARWIQRVFG